MNLGWLLARLNAGEIDEVLNGKLGHPAIAALSNSATHLKVLRHE
jgi:hypothetical protein